MSDDDSVLGDLQARGWGPDDVSAYEFTMDLLNEVIGVCSARLDEQRDDAGAVAALSAQKARYAALRAELRPGDRERVAQLREECAAIIREFNRDEERRRSG